MGRDPAAVGLLADGAAPARVRARPSRDPPGPRGARVVRDRRPRIAAPGGLPVAGLGHGAGADRTHRRGRARQRPGDRASGRLAAGRGDPGPRRLGGHADRGSIPAAGRSSSPTTTIPTSTTPPRSCWRCVASSTPTPSAVRRAIERGVRWIEGMQSSDGGWGAFDADNCRALVRDLPFCDFGEVIDPPSADVTAHALEMLGGGLGPTRNAARRRVAAGRAGGRRLVVRALGRQPRLRHRCRRARADRRRGSGADDRRSAAPFAGSRGTRTRTAAGARTAAPTTTPAGSAAARAPPRRRPGRCWRWTRPANARAAVERGVAGWSQRSGRTGAGTSRSTPAPGSRRDFYINYHLYRLVFPVMALGGARDDRVERRDVPPDASRPRQR